MTYCNIGRLDHLKRSTNLTLKPLINVDVTLKSPYILDKYINITIYLILNSQRILYRLTKQTQLQKMDEKLTVNPGWLHPHPNTHKMDEE